MKRLTYFKDGNGYIDTINRVIGRWRWCDDQPFAQWKEDWVWCWTATDLLGLSDDEWEAVFVLSTPNPHTRTPQKRDSDELYWKRKTPRTWHVTRKFRKELPTRKEEYNILI